jgi:hypothetical protein
MSWVAPPDRSQDPEPGKERVRSLRLYAHLWSEDGGYWSAERSDLSRVRDWLRSPARATSMWFAALPVGGKKHLLPYTPVNPVAVQHGSVRFEEQTVSIRDWSLCDSQGSLLAQRVRRGEIETGDYHSASWRRSAPAILTFERAWGPWRSSPWFALCLWLAGDRDVDAGEG